VIFFSNESLKDRKKIEEYGKLKSFSSFKFFVNTMICEIRETTFFSNTTILILIKTSSAQKIRNSHGILGGCIHRSYFSSWFFVKMSLWLTRRVKRSKIRHFCRQQAHEQATGAGTLSQRPRIMLNSLTEPLACPPRRDVRISRTNGDVEKKWSTNSRETRPSRIELVEILF